jgi:CHASE2 domain-containing sensor protein
MADSIKRVVRSRRRHRIKRRRRIALVLGAGASRAVSYAHLGQVPSPLDSDFFDLLQRLNPRKGGSRCS